MARDVILTYGAPFVGAVLLSVGLASAVVGGYALFQSELGLCGNPVLHVESAEDTERLLRGHGAGPGPQTLPSIPFEELSPAERDAVREAVGVISQEGTVRGEFPHREMFVQGALVIYDGEPHYATLVVEDQCVEPVPLLLPLGVVSIALGVAGVLTPPLYRRYLEFERRQGRT